MKEHEIFIEESENVKIPEQDYSIAMVTGIIFIIGGILQITLGTVKLGSLSGDHTLGLFFLIPGILGFTFGITNLIIIAIKRRRETRELLAEKYGIKKK